MKRFSPGPEISEDRIAHIESAFASFKARFRNGQKLRRRWSRTSLWDMAKEADLTRLYLTFYSWASSMHHTDATGVSFQMEHEGSDVDMAPSEQWIDHALISGHSSLIRTLSYYNEVARLGMDRDIEKAIEDFKTAWEVSNA